MDGRVMDGRTLRAASAGLALLLLTGCKAQLYSALSERDAMEMVAILLQHDIPADRTIAKDGTSTVQVEGSRIADAVSLLQANRYPRAAYATMGDVFEQKGMVSSPTAERARFIYALSQELSRTLGGIDGVLTARVHIVLPQNEPLEGDSRPAAAAVFIRHDADIPMVKLLPQIKMLVANSIEGLSYDKVSVVLLPVPRPAAPAMPKTEGPGAWSAAGWLVAAAWPLAGGAFLWWRRRQGQSPDLAAALPPNLRRVS